MNNDKLIKMFKDLSLYEESLKRHFPSKAYLNAIASIKKLGFDITDVKQVEGVPGFGKGLIEKVDVFLKTGTFPRYEEFKKSDFGKLAEMSSIKGIGVNKAKELAKAGIESLEGLKEAVKNLNVGDMIGSSTVKYINSIKVGLQFEAHTDKNRMTVKEHDEIADPIIVDLFRNYDVMASFAGSRRRWNGTDQNYTIGDIDIIIGVPEGEEKTFYKNLPKYLDEVVMEGERKVSGIKNGRQIDFRIVTKNHYGALLLHATGPMNWNIKLRKIAISKNMILNEYGLFRRDSRELVADTEENIVYELMGRYIPAKDRDKF